MIRLELSMEEAQVLVNVCAVAIKVSDDVISAAKTVVPLVDKIRLAATIAQIEGDAAAAKEVEPAKTEEPENKS